MYAKFKNEALEDHSKNRPGKSDVKTGEPGDTSPLDLTLSYTNNEAKSSRKIANNPSEVYKYTNKGNLVAIVTNGTAISGLGDVGALASKPVMEGKTRLLKKYADINAFDIELNTTDIDVFVRTVITMSPTFGAIDLEDIKAPECFEIEKRLIDALDIPVMHVDQHGTAVVTAAGLLNACEISGKKPENIKLVMNGAGSDAMACTEMYISLGLKKDNIIMLDSKGVISLSRIDLDKYKQNFAVNTNLKTLEQALAGADAFVGLSKGNILTPTMVKLMAENPIVFALAYPNHDIAYKEAIKNNYGVIYASRSCNIPNQLSNMLGFPYIFRAALDVRATKINIEMKKAAVYALASLAKEPCSTIENDKTLIFGRDYFIPKSSDFRLLRTIAPAVAKAAMDSGMTKQAIDDFEAYAQGLDKRMNK